jgi:hypothetical protein
MTTDLFVLGSFIYMIMTRFKLYLNLLNREVKKRYKKRQFLIVNSVIGGEVIQKY